MQVIGPPGVKFGEARAGKLGLNVTEGDLVKRHVVGEVMEADGTAKAAIP